MARVRSAILWIISDAFFLVVPALILFGIFLDPRKHDCCSAVSPPHRVSFGAQVEVALRRLDANRTSFSCRSRQSFRSFHALLAIPQFVRGWGWNPTSNSRVRLADEALRQRPVPDVAAFDLEAHVAAHEGRRDGGTSLIIFPKPSGRPTGT